MRLLPPGTERRLGPSFSTMSSIKNTDVANRDVPFSTEGELDGQEDAVTASGGYLQRAEFLRELHPPELGRSTQTKYPFHNFHKLARL